MTSIIILWMVEKPKGTANTKPEKLCNINTSAMEDDKRLSSTSLYSAVVN